MLSLFHATSSAGPALLMLLGALALLISGTTLLTSAIRMRREALARRIDLVAPRAVAAGRKQVRPELATGLFRLPEQESPQPDQREIIRRLGKLRIPPGDALTYFMVIRVLFAFGAAVPAVLLIQYGWGGGSVLVMLVVAAAAMVGGWVLPQMLIEASARKRANAVALGLPETLDLLVVCVDAGLSLEDALGRVIKELRRAQPALADELALLSADLQILSGRDEALMRFADRVDLPSVRSFVTTLAQTLRYGTPLAQALRIIASEMRNDALIQLEERANQLPALLTIPMMVFILPTIFLIIGGPAALGLIDVLSH